MVRLIDVGATDDVADGAIKMVTVEGRDLLLVRVGEKYYAADDRCPHMGGRLSQGRLEGTIVTCPMHGSQFYVSDGAVVRWLKGGLMSKLGGALKMSKPLRVYNVKVEGGKVLIEV